MEERLASAKARTSLNKYPPIPKNIGWPNEISDYHRCIGIEICGNPSSPPFCKLEFCTRFAVPKLKGSLAQLVQSICLTSRGSGVRTPQLPQSLGENRGFFMPAYFYILFANGRQVLSRSHPELPTFRVRNRNSGHTVHTEPSSPNRLHFQALLSGSRTFIPIIF
jgi:hypothetical protein